MGAAPAGDAGGITHTIEQTEPDTRRERSRVQESVKYALAANRELGHKTAWLLEVDWQRSRSRFASLRSIDRLYHVVFCWEWWAVAEYRLSYWAHHRLLPDLGRARWLQRLLVLQQGALLRFCYLTNKLVEASSGARFNPGAEIGPGLMLMHVGSAGIGSGARIGANFTIFQDANVMARRDTTDMATIGDNVTLFCGARVIGGVHIADNVHVGANAVVTSDLPSGCVALGVPARPVLKGQGPDPYPASSQLADLLSSLVQEGSLQEISPGRYLDPAVRTVVEASFTEQGATITTGE